MGGWEIGDCQSKIVPTGSREGQVTYDFELLDQFGERVRFYDFCHQALLVVGMTAWCPNCKAKASRPQEYYEKYRGRGFLSVVLMREDQDGNDPKVKDLRAWADQYKLTVPVVADENGSTYKRLFPDAVGVPEYVIIAPGMKVYRQDPFWPVDLDPILPR
jgi:peroxiredoxin